MIAATTSGNANAMAGFDGTLPSAMEGYRNVAIGIHALERCTLGSDNVALGHGALRNVTTGSGNIGIGTDAGAHLTTESGQFWIGQTRVDDALTPELQPLLREVMVRLVREMFGEAA